MSSTMDGSEVNNISPKIVSQVKCWNVIQYIYTHFSPVLNCTMKFSLFIPTCALDNNTEKFHTLFFLAGLSSNEETFSQMSGFQKYASQHKLMVICPDVSPRGIPLLGEKRNWHGWYVDATEEPWKKHYQMHSYITKELPELLKQHFPVSGVFGISGHSMGGHGSLVCGLRNPNIFKSISAFAPVCNPAETPFLGPVFSDLLGAENKGTDAWNKFDASELVKSYDGPFRSILVDQGSCDEYLEEHLQPKLLQLAADKNPAKICLDLRMQDGYEHSYAFLSTFVGDHFDFHGKILNEI